MKTIFRVRFLKSMVQFSLSLLLFSILNLRFAQSWINLNAFVQLECINYDFRLLHLQSNV